MQGEPKLVSNFCSYLRPVLTDFQNPITGRFRDPSFRRFDRIAGCNGRTDTSAIAKTGHLHSSANYADVL